MTNLDDLMDIWKSQDASPLHGVNETLLRLALRQDEAKLQKERRRDRWVFSLLSAGICAAMALFFSMMFYTYSGRRQISDSAHEANTAWDLVIPIVGAVSALLWGGALYGSLRAQALREQRFGESLRDQLGRRIAQLEYTANRGLRLTSVLALHLPPWVCAVALILAGYRINHQRISDHPLVLVSWIAFSVWSVAIGAWIVRNHVKQNVLPRKQRLEALLKELDSQS